MVFRSIKQYRRDCRGNVALVFALALIPMLAAGGAALDYSRLLAARTKLQMAADQAALEGARALGSTPGTAAVKEAAGSKAAGDVAAGAVPEASKTIVASAANQTVTVTLASDEKLMFGGLLGREVSTVAAKSESVYREIPVPVCLLALEPSATGITFQGTGSFLGDGCIVWSNSGSSTASILLKGSSSVRAKLTCANGKVSLAGSNAVLPPPEENCGVFPNPFASWTPPRAPSTNCDFRGTLNTNAIKPGVYCSGSKVNSSSDLVLSAGLYVIKDTSLTIDSKSRIIGADVQFLLLGNSNLSITAGSNLNLTAPVDASGKRVLIARGHQATPSTPSSITGNATLAVNGSIYLPKDTLLITGNGTLSADLPTQSIIARTIVVGGSGRIEFKGREQGNPPKAVGGQIVSRLTQ